MKSLTLFLLWVMPLVGSAAQNPSDVVTIFSSSRQFIVHGVQVKRPPQTKAPQLVRLDPAVLAVSCERIKQSMLRELEMSDQWRGRIHLAIQFTLYTNQPIVIHSQSFTDNWQYWLDLPDEVETNKLTQAIVHVLLLEMANRNARSQSAEIPLWLKQGFLKTIQASTPIGFVMQPFSGFNRREVKVDPLRLLRGSLRNQAAFSFNQLSMPGPEMLTGQAWETYQMCSQLFLMELMRLENGRKELGVMISQLSAHLNWQTAFLNAFQAHFQRLLDVEKWWSLVLTGPQGRDQWRGWSPVASLDKLDEVLCLPAQVRIISDTEGLPSHSVVTLQKFIELWDYRVQRDFLQTKIAQLRTLRMNVAPSVLPMLDAYQSALANYLQRREQAGFASMARAAPALRPSSVVQETIQQLDGLDARRENLRRRQTSPAQNN